MATTRKTKTPLKVESEAAATYAVTAQEQDLKALKKEDAIIQKALAILEKRVQRDTVFSSPDAVKTFLCLHFAQHKDYEVFSIFFLDNKHKLIAFEDVFKGTINQAAVYPREVVKAALGHGASAVILAHQHPSGDPEPSGADRQLTDRLIRALGLIDVRVLDHIVVGGAKTVSFAEKGWI